ncbi:MAG: hypothetical protein ACRDBO_02945 [Lachnospiraceae bacterium]
MKKKLIGMSVIAAAMTAAMSITAFAGWVESSNGWSYFRDDGSQVWSGWFTDPEDGAIYYIDPDGYMMSETRVSGYWLGADGRRVDKTDEEIAREAARAERENNRSAPSQSQAEATAAAQAANSSTAASATMRRSYLAEMKVFMDKYYIDTAKILTHEDIRSGSTLDNIQNTYRFDLNGQGTIISTTLWTVTLKNSINYKPYTADITYNRALLGEHADSATLDTLFKNMTIAAIGDTEGANVYNNIFEQLGSGSYNFEFSGNTDSGNYYTVSCGDGGIFLQITCNEITEADASEENTSESAEETAEETETTDTTTTSSVITVGAAADADNANDADEDTSDTEYDDNDDADEADDDENAE